MFAPSVSTAHATTAMAKSFYKLIYPMLSTASAERLLSKRSRKTFPDLPGGRSGATPSAPISSLARTHWTRSAAPSKGTHWVRSFCPSPFTQTPKNFSRQDETGSPGNPLDLVIFYLDGRVLCGQHQAVSDALKTLAQRAADVGLSLNLRKCELVATSSAAPDGLDQFFPETVLKDMDPASPAYGHSRILLGDNFDILGAPIGSPVFCASHTSSSAEKSLPTLIANSKLEDPRWHDASNAAAMASPNSVTARG